MKLEDELYRKITVKEIHEEVEGFKTFVFEEGHNIQYESGQYLTLVTAHNNEEIRRSYSITSSPILNEPLSIGVKRIENGLFSRLLIDNAKVGEVLTTIGAGGLFTLPENIKTNNQVFFFASVSGITPVLSLLKTALYKYESLSIVLVYSNASPSKTVFLKELIQLKEKFSNRFHAEFLFSNESDLSKARLHRDLLLQTINRFSADDFSEALFYICGPQSYMRMCTYTLQEASVSKDHIKKENFNIESIKTPSLLPPDKEMHTAHIYFGKYNYDVKVYYPDSVLKAAKKQGLSLPYSCEVGRCGNCLAKCVKGKVWHSYNEVLTDKELENGMVLTCVAHPVGGDIELKIGNA
ncbi:MAG: flavin reductase family protein [Flavisolibacter sp.]